MTISGLIARVTVRQSFTHDGQGWVNGIYAFPLPEQSAVDHLRMRVGERIIEGQIAERQQARATFAQAQRAGKKASLVEQQRPNLFTTRVANIGPAETVEVTIEYQQTVAYEAGWFSLRFPMTIGVRYIPGLRPVDGFDGGGWSYNTDEVPDASTITPLVTAAGAGHHNPVAITVDLDAGIPVALIQSLYHTITQTELGPHRYRLELDQNTVPADRDFVLRYRPEPNHAPRAAFFRQEVDGQRYGLLMLVPPEANWARQNAAAREVVFVIDTSGSMGGGSIEQARAALIAGFTRLKSGDRFNVVQFNSRTDALWPHPMPVTAPYLDEARRYVEGLRADGGTEMAGALQAVLDGSHEHQGIRQVVFITDGAVGNEQTLLELIDQRLGGARLFTVGIGSAPNAYFMREAAHVGRGTFTYIGDVAEVRSTMNELFAKLEFPVLSDIALVTDQQAVELYPDPLPDLYVNQPLVASLRLTAGETIELSGLLAGQPWSTSVPVDRGGDANGLDVAWARQKIASLERSLARGANWDEVREEITAIGLDYHLVTRHTSLIAVDRTPTRPAHADARDANVPNKMPAGWTMAAAGPRLPQTASPMFAHLLAALCLVVLGGVGRYLSARRRDDGVEVAA